MLRQNNRKEDMVAARSTIKSVCISGFKFHNGQQNQHGVCTTFEDKLNFTIKYLSL